jgi:hypothetical protein
MKAIDRVMAAYAKTHKLTDEQAEAVRTELSLFIEQLLDGPSQTAPKITHKEAGTGRRSCPDFRTSGYGNPPHWFQFLPKRSTPVP